MLRMFHEYYYSGTGRAKKSMTYYYFHFRKIRQWSRKKFPNHNKILRKLWNQGCSPDTMDFQYWEQHKILRDITEIIFDTSTRRDLETSSYYDIWNVFGTKNFIETESKHTPRQ